MSRPLTDYDAGRCDARPVFVVWDTRHGFTDVGSDGKPNVYFHFDDALDAAADHNHVPDCTCFTRDGEYTGTCQKHGAA